GRDRRRRKRKHKRFWRKQRGNELALGPSLPPSPPPRGRRQSRPYDDNPPVLIGTIDDFLPPQNPSPPPSQAAPQQQPHHSAAIAAEAAKLKAIKQGDEDRFLKKTPHSKVLFMEAFTHGQNKTRSKRICFFQLFSENDRPFCKRSDQNSELPKEHSFCEDCRESFNMSILGVPFRSAFQYGEQHYYVLRRKCAGQQPPAFPRAPLLHFEGPVYPPDAFNGTLDRDKHVNQCFFLLFLPVSQIQPNDEVIGKIRRHEALGKKETSATEEQTRAFKTNWAARHQKDKPEHKALKRIMLETMLGLLILENEHVADLQETTLSDESRLVVNKIFHRALIHNKTGSPEHSQLHRLRGGDMLQENRYELFKLACPKGASVVEAFRTGQNGIEHAKQKVFELVEAWKRQRARPNFANTAASVGVERSGEVARQVFRAKNPPPQLQARTLHEAKATLYRLAKGSLSPKSIELVQNLLSEAFDQLPCQGRVLTGPQLMHSGVYLFRPNLCKDAVYVGQTSNVYQRFRKREGFDVTQTGKHVHLLADDVDCLAFFRGTYHATWLEQFIDSCVENDPGAFHFAVAASEDTIKTAVTRVVMEALVAAKFYTTTKCVLEELSLVTIPSVRQRVFTLADHFKAIAEAVPVDWFVPEDQRLVALLTWPTMPSFLEAKGVIEQHRPGHHQASFAKMHMIFEAIGSSRSRDLVWADALSKPPALEVEVAQALQCSTSAPKDVLNSLSKVDLMRSATKEELCRPALEALRKLVKSQEPGKPLLLYLEHCTLEALLLLPEVTVSANFRTITKPIRRGVLTFDRGQHVNFLSSASLWKLFDPRPTRYAIRKSAAEALVILSRIFQPKSAAKVSKNAKAMAGIVGRFTPPAAEQPMENQVQDKPEGTCLKTLRQAWDYRSSRAEGYLKLTRVLKIEANLLQWLDYQDPAKFEQLCHSWGIDGCLPTPNRRETFRCTLRSGCNTVTGPQTSRPVKLSLDANTGIQRWTFVCEACMNAFEKAKQNDPDQQDQ
ncbi:unnamed protein product, partial [Durusdinium trenchii]